MTTLDVTSPAATTTVAARLARPFGARTWLRTLHLLADLPVGVLAFTVAVMATALSAALAVTLVGVPLLVLTLVAARSYGRFERGRIRVLLGVALPSPAPRGGGPAPRRWLRELGDPAAWKALVHALVALPVGIVTSTVVLVGWTTALALLAAPVSLLWRPESSYVGPLQLGPLSVAAFAAGVLLTAAMPAVVRALAAVDVAVAGQLVAGPGPRVSSVR